MRQPSQDGNWERVQPFLVSKRIKIFIPIIIVLLWRRAAIRYSENGGITQSLAFIDSGLDPINRPNRTKGLDHLVGNQLNEMVCVWRALQEADLFNRLGKSMGDEDLIMIACADAGHDGKALVQDFNILPHLAHRFALVPSSVPVFVPVLVRHVETENELILARKVEVHGQERQHHRVVVKGQGNA